MLRTRQEPLHLLAQLSQLRLKFDPHRAQLDRLLDDDDMIAVFISQRKLVLVS